MRKLVLLPLLLLLQFAAAGASITVKVLDIHGTAVAYANVVLLQAGTKALVKADYTNTDGVYKLEQVDTGAYVLTIFYSGMEPYTSPVLQVAGQDVSVQDITLAAKSTALKDVAVTAQKPFIEVKPDMLVVNVENSIVSAGSSVMEVLSRSPGVMVDQNDRVSLKGKQGVNIMINGKIQPITGADLATILKGMPANSVERIELISNPPARYDAAGTAGIINIVLKKDQHLGMNGSVNAGYGQGVYPKANTGFNLNYRNKKLNVFANYNYAYRSGFNDLVLTRNFFDNGINDFTYYQDHYATFPYHNHTANVGVDYNLSANTTVGTLVAVGNTHYATNGYVSNYASNPAVNADRTDSTAITNNHAYNEWDNYALNLNLRHKFDTTGRELSVDADYGRYWNTNTQDLTTRFYGAQGDELRQPYVLHGDVAGVTQILSFKADYSMPVWRGGTFDLGGKTSYVTADNQPIFTDRSSGGPGIYDSTKSDHFVYDENINAAYINLKKQVGTWGLQLGLRAEQTMVKGHELVTDSVFTRNYFQLFPSFAVQKKLDKNNDLGLTLSRRIERPGYSELNPYKYYADPTTILQGNPYLNPTLTYTAELSHTYRQRFITTLSYSITSDVIAEVLAPAADRVTIQTNRNIATMNYVGVSCAYPFQIFKWCSNVTNVNAYYSGYKGILDNSNLNNGQPTYDLNTTNSFTLPANYKAEMSGTYQAAQAYGFMHLEPQWMLNLGVQKTFLDKRMTVRVNATDIFYQGITRATSYYNNYNEYFVVGRDTRQVNISFTYRFGKNTVAPIHKHSSGAEDEKKRIGNA